MKPAVVHVAAVVLPLVQVRLKVPVPALAPVYAHRPVLLIAKELVRMAAQALVRMLAQVVREVADMVVQTLVPPHVQAVAPIHVLAVAAVVAAEDANNPLLQLVAVVPKRV